MLHWSPTTCFTVYGHIVLNDLCNINNENAFKKPSFSYYNIIRQSKVCSVLYKNTKIKKI